MINGMLMALETCLILGQVSHNLLCSTKKRLTDFCGPGRLTRKQLTSRPDHLARTLEINGKACEAEGKAKVVKKKSSTSKMQSISSTPRIKNALEKLEHQWLLLCPVKLRKNVGVVDPTKTKQNLRVFWKLMNPQECVWETRYRIIMKTILQEKVRIHHNTAIWFTNLFP